MSYKNIVTSEWLKEKLDDTNIIIADCRFQLGQSTIGVEAYKKEHIPGAIYMDLEKDLSAPISEHGGRHPLPTVEKMVHIFEQAGISNDKKVIAYDDQGGAMAARLWWMLKYLGHEKVYILNEGFTHWKEKGYPISTVQPKLIPTSFTPDVQQQMLASMEEVKEKTSNSNVVLIDSRAEERYLGIMETVDPVAGHIPGAINEDWQNRLGENGIWLLKEEQKESLKKYKELSNKELIVYCGSGVTACANILAFHEIDLRPKLYAGSWSDWITYKDNPISRNHDLGE
ncbi:thiosulfate/3-mercaptopyruvate sulfurtransferase [Evansella vedderi]|uniref:Thiosulfate/3-mercaptopyruvate sulfurtransferase n=1 Tax=Evansella vedderi TaxID=38282 RepID=A0ABT9ZZ28_9BACI|nr:sulfurtransferase [Evansella vedderi]MDQ0255698.1 thiosulfate/3-mercaptopyruvate sulfurtransferase [Evansella vedderi]